jgi:hypothetical protein
VCNLVIHKFLIQNYKTTPKSSKFQAISQKQLKQAKNLPSFILKSLQKRKFSNIA